MFVVHVFITVKPEYVNEFIEATMDNARESLQEPGIARFDFLQEETASDRFVLVEVYRTKEDPARHKQTTHYQKWNKTVEKMMAVPRTKKIFFNLFPDDEGWG